MLKFMTITEDDVDTYCSMAIEEWPDDEEEMVLIHRAMKREQKAVTDVEGRIRDLKEMGWW